MTRPKKWQLEALDVEPGEGVEIPKRSTPFKSRFFVIEGRTFAVPVYHGSPFIESDDAQIDYLKRIAAWYLHNEENFSAWQQSVERIIERDYTKNDGSVHNYAVALQHLCCRDWRCAKCAQNQAPEIGTQFNTAIKTLRNKGFCIIQDRRMCEICAKRQNHFTLFPGRVWRRINQKNRYDAYNHIEDRVFDVLNCYNAWDGKKQPKTLLLIEHKFPEARWKEDESKIWTKDTTDEQIKAAFQLMTNAQNLSKRQACDSCVATNIRPMDPFNIGYYYKGDNRFRADLYGEKGRNENVEEGCVGCFYYDCEEWRKALKFQNEFVSWIESAPPIKKRSKIDILKEIYPKDWLKKWISVSGFLLVITGAMSMFLGNPIPIIFGGLAAISFLNFRLI